MEVCLVSLGRSRSEERTVVPGLTACAVEETVASFDGIVDCVCTGVVVDFPEAACSFSTPAIAVVISGVSHPKPTRGISCPLFSLIVAGEGILAYALYRVGRV